MRLNSMKNILIMCRTTSFNKYYQFRGRMYRFSQTKFYETNWLEAGRTSIKYSDWSKYITLMVIIDFH